MANGCMLVSHFNNTAKWYGFSIGPTIQAEQIIVLQRITKLHLHQISEYPKNRIIHFFKSFRYIPSPYLCSIRKMLYNNNINNTENALICYSIKGPPPLTTRLDNSFLYIQNVYVRPVGCRALQPCVWVLVGCGSRTRGYRPTADKPWGVEHYVRVDPSSCRGDKKAVRPVTWYVNNMIWFNNWRINLTTKSYHCFTIEITIWKENSNSKLYSQSDWLHDFIGRSR